MVTLYTWVPKPVEALQAGSAPDLGHTALQAGDTYASFWPELDSLIGRVTSALCPREVRSPNSYAEETAPEQPYMSRPADHSEIFDGFNEAAMARRWGEVAEDAYDFAKRNCSHVGLELIQAGLAAEAAEQLQETDCLKEQLAKSGDGLLEDAFRVARHVLAKPIFDFTPETLRMAMLNLAEQGQCRLLDSASPAPSEPEPGS
jgi:hypothetical protein